MQKCKFEKEENPCWKLLFQLLRTTKKVEISKFTFFRDSSTWVIQETVKFNNGEHDNENDPVPYFVSETHDSIIIYSEANLKRV